MSILLMVFLVLAVGPAMASGLKVPLKSIAQITVDDDGRPLNYPHSVFFDPGMEEIYLINGGSGRVVVYGPDFFPRMSIGMSRGVAAPQGGLVMPDGDVYICQVRNVNSPSPRITVLNGAFFVEREIFLDQIPEAADFKPRQLAISREGTIYLAGQGARGVMVLDNEGNFLRWLKPTDIIRNRRVLEEMADQPSEEEKEQGESAQSSIGQNEEEASAEDLYAHIPEEFRPRGSFSDDESGEPREGVGPIRINYVTIDSTGKLYLISDETSRIYVYGPDESFLFAFGQKGGSPRQLSQPRALAIDEERGVIYVVDYMRHTILAYDMSGQFLFEFGGRGFAPGWFNYPSGVAINNYGQLVVVDLFNRRVQVLEVGKVEYPSELEEIETSGEASDPAGVVEEAPSEENDIEPPSPAPEEEMSGEALSRPATPAPAEMLPEESTGIPTAEAPQVSLPIVEEILEWEAEEFLKENKTGAVEQPGVGEDEEWQAGKTGRPPSP